MIRPGISRLRRRLLILSGLGACVGFSPLGVARPAVAGTGPSPTDAQVLPAQQGDAGIADVTSYGARGDGSTDDTAAIQAAINPLREGQVLLFPPGDYMISDTLFGRDKPFLTIQSQGRARIGARRGADFTGKSLLDLSGSTHAQVINLRIDSRYAAADPAAGLVLGRTGSNNGGGIFLQTCSVEGRYTTASVYNAGCEVVAFHNCVLQSETAQPTYWDTSTDYANLSGAPGEANSNTRKFFWACALNNYSGAEFTQVIRLEHVQAELAFRDCYFSLGHQSQRSSGHVISIVGSEPNAITNQLLIDNYRVEGPSSPSSRLIHVNNTNGLQRLRLNNLNWTLTSDYYIELAAALGDSDIWFSGMPGSYMRVNAGARLVSNRLYGSLAGKIQLEAGAAATGNLILSSNGSPFSGPGLQEGNTSV